MGAAMERDIPNYPNKYDVKSYGARGDGSSGVRRFSWDLPEWDGDMSRGAALIDVLLADVGVAGYLQ